MVPAVTRRIQFSRQQLKPGYAASHSALQEFIEFTRMPSKLLQHFLFPFSRPLRNFQRENRLRRMLLNGGRCTAGSFSRCFRCLKQPLLLQHFYNARLDY
ncbi:hypothetical protein D3C74_399190 [compost metagenome]